VIEDVPHKLERSRSAEGKEGQMSKDVELPDF